MSLAQCMTAFSIAISMTVAIGSVILDEELQKSGPVLEMFGFIWRNPELCNLTFVDFPALKNEWKCDLASALFQPYSKRTFGALRIKHERFRLSYPNTVTYLLDYFITGKSFVSMDPCSVAACVPDWPLSRLFVDLNVCISSNHLMMSFQPLSTHSSY